LALVVGTEPSLALVVDMERPSSASELPSFALELPSLALELAQVVASAGSRLLDRLVGIRLDRLTAVVVLRQELFLHSIVDT
jgi:hypothetical protein